MLGFKKFTFLAKCLKFTRFSYGIYALFSEMLPIIIRNVGLTNRLPAKVDDSALWAATKKRRNENEQKVLLPVY
jgi:hypothetical protein